MLRELINQQKKLHKHTNAHLAKECNCSVPTISSFLCGKKGIKYDILMRLIEVYNLKVIKIVS